MLVSLAPHMSFSVLRVVLHESPVHSHWHFLFHVFCTPLNPPFPPQGLNFVVRLLLALVDEEHAFWLLAAIVEDMRLPDFYSRMPVRDIYFYFSSLFCCICAVMCIFLELFEYQACPFRRIFMRF
jgi:hypothetical protein